MILPLQQIEGKYEALAKLGEGGMGAVYKVRHRLLDEIRVIKIMRSSIAEDEDARARFLREARAASRLRHPNIAQLYDFSVDADGTSYIVMEYVEGVTLEELLRRRGPTSVSLALEIAIHSLRALESIHRENMVHRDIAPDNLMLTRDPAGRPFVKLVDLGIAKSLESEHTLTEKGMFIGKMRYASPEQFGGSEGGASVDPRSDLYSFGVVFYELLTGTYPIAGNDFQTLIAGHLFRPPIPFEESDPNGRVPPRLRAAVLTALSKPTDERFASASRFCGELEEILEERRKAGGEDPVAEVTFVLEALRRGRGEVEARPGSTQDRLDMRFAVADPTGVPPTEESQEPPGELPTRMLETQDREALQARARRERLASLLKEGRNFLALGELAEAQQRAASALELDPEATGALSLSRQIEAARRNAQLDEAADRLGKGELEAAEKLVQAVLDQAPEDPRAQALVKEARDRQEARERARRHEAAVASARRSLEQGDLERARGELETVLQEDGEHHGARSLSEEIDEARRSALVAEGQELLKQGEPTEAEERAQAVLAQAPSHQGARSLVAAATQIRRDAETALVDAKELLASEDPQGARRQLEGLPAEHRRLREARRLEKQIDKLEERLRKAEAARQAEEARRREQARRAEEERQRAEEARRAEESRKAEEARLAEEARRAEEDRRQEQARRAQESPETTRDAVAAAEPQPAPAPKSWGPQTELEVPPASPAPEARGRLPLLPLAAAAAGLLVIGVVALLLLLGRERPEPEPVPLPPAVAGHLLIDAIPWAEVIRIEGREGQEVAIEGDRHTPLAVPVPPGEYTVLLRHPVHGDESCAALRVETGAEASCTARFAAVDLERYFQEAGW